MPVQSKELGILAGVGVATFIAGSLVGYLLSNKGGEQKKPVQTEQNPDLATHDSNIRYIISNSLKEPSVLRELREHAFENLELAIMMTDPLQCQLFRIILKSLNAKKCLEVGVFTGYNTLNMALCLPADGKVVGLDINEQWDSHRRPFFRKAGSEHKIEIKINPAADSMENLLTEGEAGTFDFIYINTILTVLPFINDGEKISYDTYYEKGLLLLRKGGIIVLDNMLQNGLVACKEKIPGPEKLADVEALDTLVKKIHVDSRVEMSYLNIADGVVFVRKQ